MKTIPLKTVLAYLDDSFRPFQTTDPSRNGLQVQAPEQITTVGFAVDACQAVFEVAAAEQVDLLVVHHGLYWRQVELAVEQHYRRLKLLMERNMGLYAMHLPLDAHPELGNNRQLAERAGADRFETFARDHDLDIGCIGIFGKAVGYKILKRRIDEALGVESVILPFGPRAVKRLGIVSGGGGSYLIDAIEAGCDAFLTGEPEHVMYHLARERGITAIMAGHYATETVGLRALMQSVAVDLQVQTVFIDYPTGL